MRQLRQKLVTSIWVFMLCVAMFIGATFAWFTDSAISGGNVIRAGNLDVKMYWTDNLDKNVWYDVEDPEHNTIFNYDNWEPGYTEVRYIKVVNEGNLALNYNLAITPVGEVGKLAEVINVFYKVDKNGFKADSVDDLDDMKSIGLLKNVMNGRGTAKGTLLAEGQSSPLHNTKDEIITIAMNMITTAGNEYQGKSIGDGFEITALATQCAYEADSFGSSYDSNARYPDIISNGQISTTVTNDNGKVATGGVTIAGDGLSAVVPEGVELENGVDRLTLSVTPLDESATNITTVNQEILIPVDVHISGVSENNTTPIIINLGAIMPKNLNMGNYTLYHVEDGENQTMTYVELGAELSAHNQFKYDPMTGELVVAMASFSEIAVLADEENMWNGTVATAFARGTGTEAAPYIIANADQLAYMGNCVSNDNENYGSKHYKLIADVNIGGSKNSHIWYPIGYNKVGGEIATVAFNDDLDEIYFEPINSAKPGDKDGDVVMAMADNSWYTYGGSFKGVFDGTGHKVSGIYQNTWAMKGDYDGHYYNDAMGLFGYVNGGDNDGATIKNLTIDSFYSEGEFAPTGCVTAYADGNVTFENIAITNSHPQTYNTGVAGIVGWDNGNNTSFTFRNITVDDTNTMSALWGSWDVAASGILGSLKNGSEAYFENCNVTATIDVYNDVCGNYQYYWYRYSGAYIGTVYKRLDNGNGALDLSDVTATNCTADFGTRHEYYYCEFVENTKASYTHDYQFSRVDNKDIVGAGASATCQNHNHEEHGFEMIDGKEVLVEDKQAVHIPYRQLFGGYGWGVDGVDLGDYKGIDITVISHAQTKFDSKFTGDFLYRVGNGNTVSVGTLFGATNTWLDKEGKEQDNINDSGVYVSIDKVDENSNVSGTFTANKSDWTKGTIQFGGTGVVKVTIQDYDFCTPTVVYLEVVDGYNVTKYSELKNRNSVLLNEITMSSGSSYYILGGATLYGNGFTFDCRKGAYTGSGSISENYVIGLVDAHLNNVEVVGEVYTTYGAQASNNYNRALVVSKGSSSITNCYLSNTASPVRLVEGNLTIKGTTVKGGNFANVDVRNGHLVVEDVTTINQSVGNDKADGKTEVIGLGIIVYYENVDTSQTSIDIRGTLTQYNHISSNDTFTHEYATQFVNQMMTGDYSEFRTEIDGVKWVNTGVISLTGGVIPSDHRNDKGGYSGKEVSFMSQDGYVYSVKPTEASVKENAPEYETLGQGSIAPTYSFDYTTKNYIQKTDGSNDYCYYENGKVLVAMDQGDTFEWDPFILTATKLGKTLDYTVSMGGTTYATGSKIAFNTSGDYEVTYTYTDGDNYILDKDGKLVTTEQTYTKTVSISVSVIKPSTQHATFTFADTNTATEKVTVNDKTYISAKGVNATDKEWGYITVNGTKILYPITEAQMKKSILGNEVQVYYYVFKDAVTITDYKDGGTGGEQKYDASTTAMPSNLTVVNGMEAKYTAISSACVDISKLTKDGPSGEVWDFSASTTVSGTTKYNGYLAHSSPSGLAIKSGTRDYDAITVAQFSYTDAAGSTFYYFVGYFMQNQVSSGGGGCVTPDTLVTLADGTQKEIQHVTYKDQLLVWDFYNGEYAVAPAAVIFNMGTGNFNVLKLRFEDDTVVKTINGHRFFDKTLDQYVLINESNVEAYIGHDFVKMEGDGYKTVQLEDYSISEEYTTSYSVMSAYHYNFIVEGILSDTFHREDASLFEYFTIGNDMKYDENLVKADIEKYGLYTYEEFSDYLTHEQFVALNVQYMKISVGKGQFIYEDILKLIDMYLNK